jgi:hypothetical protein
MVKRSRVVSDENEGKFTTEGPALGNAFAGLRVALRPTTTDGLLDVYHCHQWVGSIDLKKSF